MTESLAQFFAQSLGQHISREVLVFLVSMLPILELRGGILVGALLGMKLLPNFCIAFLGNILPIPFILLLIERILQALKKNAPKKAGPVGRGEGGEKEGLHRKIRLLGDFAVCGHSAAGDRRLDRGARCLAAAYGPEKGVPLHFAGGAFGRSYYDGAILRDFELFLMLR